MQARGELDEALRILREVLAIYEQVRDPASTAMTYHQLGNVSYLRADYDAALDWYPQVRWRSRSSSATAPVWPAATTSWAMIA